MEAGTRSSPILALRRDVALVESAGEGVALESPHGRFALANVKPAVADALRALAAGGASEERLSELALESGGAEALATLYYHLDRWNRLALLSYIVELGGEPLATVEPMSRDFQLGRLEVAADTRFLLSRFACLRREGDALLLESPLAPARVVIHGGAGAALVAALVRPHTYPDLSDSRAGLTADAARVFVGMLASAGAITRLPEDASIEDEDANLAQWEFHDLFFHSRSRQGRHDRPFGGTYPFLGRIEPLPAVKPKPTGERFVLHRPDLEEAERNDPPLGRVLDERRSIRAYASEPVSAEQLGEFLYRVARVRSVEDADPTQGRYYALSRRPYPSGGATYDLELYVTINVCTRLPPGLYHYDPLDHELRKLSDRDERVEALLHYASMSTGVPHLPQVLITLASRFQRLSWKYRSMAYATTLKNVGVLYQTMYLVATAMGLAPCALGGGNSDVFAEAAGTDYYAESSVGEFVLGSVPDDA